MLKQTHLIIYIAFLFLGSIISAQTITIIDEDFTTPALPAGWSNINNGGTATQIWQFNANRGITAGGINGNYAILDSDAYGSGNNQNASLLTSTFSADLYEAITLEFDYQYRDFNGGESCVIEVFNGTDWIEVFRKEFGEENYVNLTTGATSESINIKSDVGSATNAQIKFTYIGVWDYWWAIDNVKVLGELFTPTNTDYLGPGGVGGIDGGSDLVLWTKAEELSESANLDPVETWSDASGYSSDLTQPNSVLRPLFLENSLNGYNAVRFDATAASNSLKGKRLVKTPFANFPTSAISGFYVNKTTSAAEGGDGVLSYASTGRNNDFLLFNSNNLTLYRNNLNRPSSLNVSTATWNIVGFRWNSSDGIGNISNNNNESGNLATMNSGVNIVAGGSLALAGEQDSVDTFGSGNNDGNYVTSQSHQGDFTEVIIYNSVVNLAQRNIISNYLSAKYSIAINAATNFYTQDEVAAGNFDHDVAGIGQATDGSNHTDSQGTGIVRIYNPSNLANDEYLFWGRDNKDDIVFETNEDNYQQRTSTKWRVSKRNEVGDVSFILDLSSIDLSSKEACSTLRLIVDNDSDLLSPTSAYNLVDIGGGLYKANNVVFSDNDYFAVEYQDLIVVDDTQYYNGSGDVNVPDLTNGCYKLLVKSTSNGSLALTEDAIVREIEIESGGVLSVNSGVLLKVINGIVNNGDIRLVGNSQLVQTHNTGVNLNSGTGNLHVDQTGATSTVFQSGYWSSPVRKSGTVAGTPYAINDVLKDGTNVSTSATPSVGEAADVNFTSNLDGNAATDPIEISSRWLAKFINASDWTRFLSPTDAIFTPGEGWNMKSVGATFTFLGTPNDGDYSFALDQNKFNLIGNPYPSALDAEAFITDNSSSFNGVIYIYNGLSDDTHVRGDYSGTYNTIVSGVTVGGGRYLPIGQAFFVTKETAGSGTLTFRNSQRTLTTLSNTGAILAKSKAVKSSVVENEKELPTLKIDFKFDLSETKERTRTVATVFRGLTDEYDMGFDAVMWGLQPTDLYLKVKGSDSPYIITGTFDFDNTLQLPLVVQLDEDREVHFSISEKIKIDSPVYLHDKVLNTYYDLGEGSKTLNLPTGEYTDRFFITFTSQTLSNPEVNENEYLISVYGTSDGKLTIENKTNIEIEAVKVYNLLGAQIFNFEVENSKEELNFNISKLAKAVYIIAVETEKGTINKKIIIE